MPEISVIMSIYNEPVEWMKLAIDSILSQTFTDFELLIVNDNPDREENCQIPEEYSKKDKRVRIITNERNLGLPKSLNRAALESRGRYIARMDADDISLSTRFQKQLDFMDSHTEIGVCGTAAKIIDGSGAIKRRIHLQYSPKDLKDAIYFFSPFIHPTVMMRREILLDNLYDEKCRVAQDWNLWLRLSEKTKFANLKEVLLHYRIHDNQSQKKAGKQRSRESREYSDGVFADFLHLDGKLRNMWIRSRSDDYMPIQELDELYDYLINNCLSRSEERYALGWYLRKAFKLGKDKLFSNKLVRKYPFKTLKSGCFEVIRVFL